MLPRLKIVQGRGIKVQGPGKGSGFRDQGSGFSV
jgi:hypothetical protein